MGNNSQMDIECSDSSEIKLPYSENHSVLYITRYSLRWDLVPSHSAIMMKMIWTYMTMGMMNLGLIFSKKQILIE